MNGTEIVVIDHLGLIPFKRSSGMSEAKAIGGACRHALRAIEDCYTLNPKADKSAVYDGWREMDEYMRENKLDGIVPVVPRPAPSAPAAKASVADDAEEEVDTAADEKADKPAKAAKPKKGAAH